MAKAFQAHQFHKIYLQVVTSNKLKIAILIGLTGLSSFFVYKNAFLSKKYIDEVVNHRGFQPVLWVILALAGLALLAHVMEVVKSYLLTHITNTLNLEFSRKFIHVILDLPLSVLNLFNNGRIQAINDDISRVQSIYSAQLLNVFNSLVMIVSLTVTLYSLLPVTVLIVIASCIIELFVKRASITATNRIDNERYENNMKVYGTMYDIAGGLQDINRFRANEVFKNRYLALLGGRIALVQKQFKTHTLYGAANFLSQTVFTNTVTIVAIYLVIANKITLGSFYSLTMLSSQLKAQFQSLTFFYENIRDFKHVNRRLGFSVPDSVVPPAAGGAVPAAPRLRLDALGFLYNDKPVIRDLNFEFPGRVLLINGPNGTGKSTLLKLISGELAPATGTVQVFNGTRTVAPGSTDLYRTAFVGADSYIYDESILFNITFGDEPDARLEQIIQLVELEGILAGMTDGIRTRVGGSYTPLSSGQRQRIIIARCLYHESDVLLLDESFSHLDREAEKRIMRRIVDFYKKTIVFVSHNDYHVDLADGILTLQPGGGFHYTGATLQTHAAPAPAGNAVY